MCSTCDPEKFTPETMVIGRREVVRLKNTEDELDIHCNVLGYDYKIGNFTIYRCPTCGKKLY